MDIQNASLAVLEKKLERLKSKVHDCFPLIKGCVTVIGGKNKLPRFTAKKNGKSYSMYLGAEKASITKKYIERYHKLSGIINEMSEINLEIIRRMDVPRAKKSA
jgi:hypothetical protein